MPRGTERTPELPSPRRESDFRAMWLKDSEELVRYIHALSIAKQFLYSIVNNPAYNCKTNDLGYDAQQTLAAIQAAIQGEDK